MEIRLDWSDTITTSLGKVKGNMCDNHQAIAWLGIPYAKPPIGELRWKAPVEAEPWNGTLEAQTYSNKSVQAIQGESAGEEDCLYLNIWRPNHGEEHLPVLLFLHGGGNIAGSGQDFTAEQLSPAINSIVVTINYRLGAMGYFCHPALHTGDVLNDSGNYALLDIIHALKWIQQNITYFGGDRSNITLSGQSAGARNALALSISPLAQGLFHRLFVMSGGLTTATIEQGEKFAHSVLTKLLMNSKTVTSEEEAQTWISSQSNEAIKLFLCEQPAFSFAQAIGETELRMERFPHLFEDGWVIPYGGFKTLQNKPYHNISVMVGSTGSEFSGFALAHPQFLQESQTGELLKHPAKREFYKAAITYGNELYAAFNAEQVANTLFRSNKDLSIYTYRFHWGLNQSVLEPIQALMIGAFHGADLPFLTGHYEQALWTEGIYNERNRKGREQLSALMRAYLRNFMYTGSPNGNELPAWPQWSDITDNHELLSLDADCHESIVLQIAKLDKEIILQRLEHDHCLSEDQRKWLTTQLFAGRFFW